MRKFILSCILALAIPLSILAQGWPANYGGVMLQGFYWDSQKETNWKELTKQADELSKYFDLIWVPNSGTPSSYYHNSTSTSMGYDPCFWLTHNSSFGTEEELRTMIATYKAKGTGIIEDVVINHKNGLSDWCDFPTENVTGRNTGKTYTMSWSLADICKNDECANEKDEKGNQKYPVTGADDTGDNFDGFRDLDHTSANVQHNIDVYLDFLLNELGYAGFRYDMVKGYGAEYIKKYNDASQPQFSVGEYWDNKNNVAAWIRGTQFTSAAFDFGLHDAMRNYFNNGIWDIADKGNAADPSLSRYAVTFVDNHDTFREANTKVSNNILAANAFILALPGTPCIFWPHWTVYKKELAKMINARKEAGITNTSKIIHQAKHGNGYVTIVEGEKQNILVISGMAGGIDDMLKDYDCISSGDNYAYYISKEKPAVADNGITIYVKSSDTPSLYVWEADGTKLNGAWEECNLMPNVYFVGDECYHSQTFYPTSGKLNFIIRNSENLNTNSGNIEGISSNVFYTYDNGIKEDITSSMSNAEVKYLPTYTNGEICAYFEASGTDYPNVNVWAWGANNTNYTGGNWPGAQATWLANLPNGNKLWKWKAEPSATPTHILFNDGKTNNTKQTADFAFTNGGYYSPSGLFAITYSPINVESVNNITLREFTANQFATLCLPYDVATSELETIGGKFYKYSSETDGVLYFSEASSLQAWNPYVYIASETGKNLNTLTSKIAVSGSPLSVTHGNFTFVGTSTDKTLISNDNTTYYGYKKTDGTFVKVGTTNGAKIGAWKCYFTTQTAKAVKAKRSVFEGVATGIETVKTLINHSSNDIYTIDGKKVTGNKLPKGLYIYNGKKLIIR
ncbi:alpha-amylase family glycosyl hydrolase [Prevotella sp.]|uniref:alpha-amylase family glycosyl hydrolase n=1 Tax=Prevotella sp. TaxID=59823 RepID=UPI0027E28CA5|nr:alpha-amylase family glycosyl hydrolase [Prevotella sp.]